MNEAEEGELQPCKGCGSNTTSHDDRSGSEKLKMEYVLKLFMRMPQLYYSEVVLFLNVPISIEVVIPQTYAPCEKGVGHRGVGVLLVRTSVKRNWVIQYSSTISNDRQTDDLFAYLIS